MSESKEHANANDIESWNEQITGISSLINCYVSACVNPEDCNNNNNTIKYDECQLHDDNNTIEWHIGTLEITLFNHWYETINIVD